MLHRNGYHLRGNTRSLAGMDLLDTLPRVQAEYDPTQSCIGRTREEVLRRVKEWVDLPDDRPPRIFWLHGMAGEGKSAITASVAEWMDQSRNCLGASFCFSRQYPDRAQPDLLFSTIAYQLSRRFPLLSQYIEDVLRQDPDITKASAYDQFVSLLLDPLESTAWAFYPWEPLVLVLDGLDQCGTESTRLPLRSVLRRLNQLPIFVKVFISSRPARDLRGLFDSMDRQVEQFDLNDISSTRVDGDIQTFVEARMPAIVKARGELFGVDWPDESIRRALIHQSSSSFLWASRAIDFIDFDDSQRIYMLVDGLESAWETTTEFQGLEDIYLDALEEAYPDSASAASLRQFRDIVGMIVTVKQVSPPDLLGFLPTSTSPEVIEVVSRLRSIMTITGPNHDAPGTVRIIHPSFADFLSSVRCPSRFSIDIKTMHAKCARGSMMRMNQRLKRNICNIEDESVPNTEIPDLKTRLRVNVTDDLRYSCRFWAYHLSQSRRDDGELYEYVKSFFCEDLRKWIEILSLLGVLDHVNESLELCRGWIIVSGVPA
jgi:hypothetical protein